MNPYGNMLGISLILVLIWSCKPGQRATTTAKPIPFERTAEVQFVESASNTITLISAHRAENQQTAIVYAEVNALENLLFRGIPGSNQENPMIEDENMIYKKHGDFLKRLLDQGTYRQFMIASENEYTQHFNTMTQVKQLITIDLKALRKHLESNGVVRSFGL